MKIQQNKVVSLNYKLSNHNTGETIEETNTENPMVFLYGVGSIIPEFEENIFEKQVGDQFDFSILAANAYGTASEDQIANIPLAVFTGEEGKELDREIFFEGALIPMSDSEGNHLRGKIKEITAEDIIMDFNHPLADIDLHFSGEILAIREATADEIAHGHVHGEGGVHH